VSEILGKWEILSKKLKEKKSLPGRREGKDSWKRNKSRAQFAARVIASKF